MKKSYLTLAAVAAIMASCTNEVLIDKVETPEVAIGFETFNNKATKAENSSMDATLSLYQHHPSFAVWGYKDVQTDGYVFGTSNTEGTVVNGSEGADKIVTWAYSPLRFWDKNANRYDFYAAAPVTADDSKPKWTLNGGAAIDKQQVNYFTLADVVLEDKTLIETEFTEVMKSNDQTNIDYMIASENHAENNSTKTYPATVQLTFNHILSRLNVTMKRGESLKTIAASNPTDAKLTIVKLEVRNMVSKGSFNEHADIVGSDGVFDAADKDALQEGTIKRWTLSGNTADVVTYKGYVASDEAKDVKDAKFYMLQSLVMPQNVGYEKLTRDGKDADGRKIDETGCSITQPYLYIEYTIGTEDQANSVVPETFKAYYNLADAFGSKIYQPVTVAVGESVKDFYTTTDGETYSPCGAADVAVSGTTYYEKVPGGSIAFNEGWQNTLNLTVDVDAIVLDANVYKWADGEINDLDVK